MNFALCLLAVIQNSLLLTIGNVFLLLYILFGLRDIFMVSFYYWLVYKRDSIDKIDRNNIAINKLKFILFFSSSVFIETITYLFIHSFYVYKNSNILTDLLFFIPISFMYEIIFDFFHYLSHRLLHKNRFLYTNIHKIHHSYSHCNAFVSYFHHPLDLVITNSIPQMITLCIIPKISFYTMNAILIYKIFIEISGHSGKKIKSSSFSQCYWLPKFLGIELKTEDHDIHHTLNNKNYSKRFKLWDIVFGTYKQCE
jgi:sterol desaturase/sphingolipid hydroxylase (fatty acid hydroxylase superfamily)